jgi:hypothetical protein
MGLPGIEPVPAEWVFTAAAARLLAVARERVFTIRRKRGSEEDAGPLRERLQLVLEVLPPQLTDRILDMD